MGLVSGFERLKLSRLYPYPNTFKTKTKSKPRAYSSSPTSQNPLLSTSMSMCFFVSPTPNITNSLFHFQHALVKDNCISKQKYKNKSKLPKPTKTSSRKTEQMIKINWYFKPPIIC